MTTPPRHSNWFAVLISMLIGQLLKVRFVSQKVDQVGVLRTSLMSLLGNLWGEYSSAALKWKQQEQRKILVAFYNSVSVSDKCSAARSSTSQGGCKITKLYQTI